MRYSGKALLNNQLAETECRITYLCWNLPKVLRPWAEPGTGSLPRVSSDRFVVHLEPISRDIGQVIREYEAMRPIDGHHVYLEDERNIPSHVLSDPRFAERIRTDRYRNAVFPHYNRQGLCGFELKNRCFNGFAKGGEKGLWPSMAKKGDQVLVIVEAAIDALSYHAIHEAPEKTRYISIGGSPNPEQPALIISAIQHMSQDNAVIIATDNDTGGDHLAEDIRQWIDDAARPDIQVIEDRPLQRERDWNDVLRSGEPFPRNLGFSFPFARISPGR